MAAKVILVLCASTLIAEVLCQCIGRDTIMGPYVAGWPCDGLGAFDGLSPFDGIMPYGGLTPFDGLGSYYDMMPFDNYGFGTPWSGFGAGTGPFGPGITTGFGSGLVVTSASPIAPTGLIVTSENAIEGVVAVTGQLPFLGAVVTDGAFATAGAGAVSYGCGDGAVGIVAEAPTAPIAPIVPAFGCGIGPDPLGYSGVTPYGQWGCGCMY